MTNTRHRLCLHVPDKPHVLDLDDGPPTDCACGATLRNYQEQCDGKCGVCAILDREEDGSN